MIRNSSRWFYQIIAFPYFHHLSGNPSLPYLRDYILSFLIAIHTIMILRLDRRRPWSTIFYNRKEANFITWVNFLYVKSVIKSYVACSQGRPTTFFFKMSVRRNKHCLSKILSSRKDKTFWITVHSSKIFGVFPLTYLRFSGGFVFNILLPIYGEYCYEKVSWKLWY